jgi:hypothetical protein
MRSHLNQRIFIITDQAIDLFAGKRFEIDLGRHCRRLGGDCW